MSPSSMNTSASDLDACASEPIRIPGAIQPHGRLLVLRADSLAVSKRSARGVIAGS